MELTGFSFPGVTLKQNFVANSTTGAGSMSVFCIGEHIRVHDYATDIDPVAFSTVYTGTAISGLALPGYQGGDITGSTVNLYCNDGLFNCFDLGSTTISTQPTATDKSSITFSAALTGSTTSKAVEPGDSVMLTYKSGTTVTANKTMTVIDIDDTKKKITVSGDAYISGSSITAALFCSQASATLGTASVTSGTVSLIADLSGSVVIDGTTYSSRKLKSGIVGADYKEADHTYRNDYGVVTSTNAAIEALGTPCVDNPLALCVYQAVANSAGNPVYFSAVGSTSSTAYETAMAVLDNNSDVYSVVPATYDSDVIGAILEKCISLSNDEESKVRRVLWYGVKTDLVAGTNQAAVKLDVAAKKGSVQSYRAVCVWADSAKYNGEEMPNYAVAAAAAGLRSSTYCHQPISNTHYSSFTVSEPHKLTMELYRQVAANGIWVVGNNSNGVATNFKQITTAQSANNINLNEESCVANADNVALSICNIGADLVGCSNISSGLLVTLSNMLDSVMTQKTINTSGSSAIGPQLLDWQLVSLAQNTVNLDHVDATITCTPPRPFNKFNMTLTIL